jgi:hypothetical protein
MSKHRTAEDKRKIAISALQMSFRSAGVLHGMSEAGVRKLLKTQLRTLFNDDELKTCSDTSDLRRLYNKVYAPDIKKAVNFRKPTSQETIKQIKTMLKFKTPEQIAESFRVIGLKDSNGEDWTAETIETINKG